MSIRPGKSALALALLLMAAGPPCAQAKELYGREAGVIPFGMGRAYSAIADDSLALHYNPAGLAMVKKLEFQLFDFRLGVNQQALSSYGDVKTLGKGSSSGIADGLGALTGKQLQFEAGNTTQLTMPKFSVAMIYNVHLGFDMQNQSYPVMETRYTKDLGVVGGFGFGVGKRQDLRLGAAVKWIRRIGGKKSIPFTQVSGSRAALLEQFSANGSGVGGDFGMQYRLPIPGRTEVTTSFVWHDIGDTTFGKFQQKDPPTKIAQNMVAGLGIRFPIGGMKNRRLERRYGATRSNSHLSFAFDYSHLNISPKEEHLPKHLHFGMNLDLPILSLQMGMNQTSFTYGFSFDIDVVRVAFASYAEELGSYGGQRPDRRYLLSIGTGFGFGGF